MRSKLPKFPSPPERFRSRSSRRAFSLIEVLVVVAVMAILAAFALPVVENLHESADTAKSQANAQRIASISSSLASMGVAHVLPDSLGGVEATTRLLREGVTVPEGIFAGQFFIIAGLSDSEITDAAAHLEVVYDFAEIRLQYKTDATSS